MRRCGTEIVLVLQLVALGCGGDSGGGGTGGGGSGGADVVGGRGGGLGGSGAGGSGAGGTGAGGTSPGIGGAPAACKSTLNAGGRSGSAKIMYMNQTMNMPERACETLRRPDGTAFGWAAYFGVPAMTDKGPEFQFPAFSVTVTRGFTGDGTYESGGYVDNKLGVAWFIKLGQVGTGTASPSTVVVSNGGKAAVLDVDGVIHAELTCDPTDDTSTKAGTALDPAAAPPGFVYLVDEFGALRIFDCLHCILFNKVMSLDAPSSAPDFDGGGFGSHTFISLGTQSSMEITGPGSYEFQGRIGWRLGVRDFHPNVELKTVRPSSGTFSVTNGPFAGPLSGSFQCVEDDL